MTRRSLLALGALNFFVADVRDGLGPFLGVFLQSQAWSPAEIGMAMTIGGLAGVMATVPAGLMVDSTKAKRAVLMVAAIAIVVASAANYYSPDFMVTAAAQAISGIAGAVIPAAIAAITLGLVLQRGFAHQLGRNEAFNHAGNVVAALLAGGLGYLFGLGAVFAVMSVLAVAAIASTALINPADINHAAARGSPENEVQSGSGFSIVLTSVPLLVLAATLLLFHLGNAAMLPLLGQAIVARGGGDPSALTGMTVIIAQLTMIPMALAAAALAERRGYWVVLLLALLALPIRGAIAAYLTSPYGLIPVQMLDGVGAGLLGVAVPGLTARILSGTGHVNAGIGIVMTLQGVGAALSPALGGEIAERFGYAAAFAALGLVATAGLVLWAAMRPLTAPACRA